MEIRKEKEYLTYADYCTWNDGQRWELIDGEAYLMAAPTPGHQIISGNLFWKFREYLQGKKCMVFHAACDVRLNADKGDDTVVQPDLIVVCDPEKIGKTSINGTPDLIIEIFSSSTKKYDMTTKFIKYRETGVKELWYVDPDTQIVQVFKLEKGEYLANVYDSTDKITVGILPELTIDMRDIFEQNEGEIS